MCRKLRGIIITGFMGTGKTSVGRSLSRRLNMEFIDLDEEIEKESGMRIHDIFSQMEEAGFRDIERRMLRKVLQVSGRIISTGGGTVLSAENLSLMNTYGMIICLWAKPAEILNRLVECRDRPLLKEENRLAAITELLEERRARYLSSGKAIQTDGRDVEDIAMEIASIWRESVDC